MSDGEVCSQVDRLNIDVERAGVGVPPPDNVVSIGLGVNHACAVIADGSLHCWGDDGNGQLGNGSATGTQADAHQVVIGTQVIAALGGYQHACALTQDGVYCWGSDGAGQLGNGSTTTGTQISPVAAPMPVNSTYIPPTDGGIGFTVNSASTFQRGRILGVGRNHACMVVPAGSVVNEGNVDTATGPASTRSTAARVACWGLNDEGQLGGGHPTADGGTALVNQNRPRFVTSALSGAPVAVATGSRHSCALTAAGRVYCWGRGVEGQVGTEFRTAADPYEVPTLVPGLTNVVSITAGYDHTCALLADGQARCWGHNNRYLLGRSDSASESAVPRVVQVQLSGSTCGTLGNLVAISAGNWHTCAVTASGQVYCWGTNHLGQCGRPDYDSRTDQVIGARRVFSGWSDSTHTGTELASTMVSVSVGLNHSCAVSFNGDSYCWGSNSNRQITTSTSASYYRTAQSMVGRLPSALGLSAGGDATCALHRSATSGSAYVQVSCWGENDVNQAGITKSSGDLTTPTVVTQVSSYPMADTQVQVATGDSFSCALSFNGQVNCWGSNSVGQLGRGVTGTITSSTAGTAAAVVDLQ